MVNVVSRGENPSGLSNEEALRNAPARPTDFFSCPKLSSDMLHPLTIFELSARLSRREVFGPRGHAICLDRMKKVDGRDQGVFLPGRRPAHWPRPMPPIARGPAGATASKSRCSACHRGKDVFALRIIPAIVAPEFWRLHLPLRRQRSLKN